MKIRSKITLIFTLLTGSLLLGVFVFIYYFSYRYTETEFFERLRERTDIIAQIHLERDELSSTIYDETIEKHFQILPYEEEAVLRVNASTKNVIDKDSADEFPAYFLKEIFDNKYAQVKVEDVFHAGILYSDNQGDFIVVTSAKDLYGKSKLTNLRNILIIALFASLSVIYIIGRFYAGKVLNPIAGITAKANKISASNLHLRLDLGRNRDELSELMLTFNNMLERLETAFEIQTNFVNNASHELRNPLTAILGETEVVLRRERSAEEYRNSFSRIEKEAHRLDLLVTNLLKLARAGHDDKGLFIELIRTDELLIDVKESIDIIYPDSMVNLDFSKLPADSEQLVINGNRSLVKMALINILDNACKFSMNKEVKVSILPLEKCVEISVQDQGVGIPESDFRDIAEPFFRASNARSFNGFGMGLPLAQKIIRLHGGSMTIFSKVNVGTEVKISFPLSEVPPKRF